MMHEKIRIAVSSLIRTALEKIDPEIEYSQRQIYAALVDPPNIEMAHLAFGCFILAKQLRKNPATVAGEVNAALQGVNDLPEVHVEAAGPYLNFKFGASFLFRNVVASVIDRSLFAVPLTDPEKIVKTMIEYSQPNTHKELHVGHMRNLCLGDAIVRLCRRVAGDENVISATFPGDVGTHVAKCLWFIKHHVEPRVFAETKKSPKRGEWLGQMYSAGNLRLEDEAKNPELFEKNKKQLTEILKQLEAGHGEFFDLWKETRPWSIDLMNSVYQWANVKFDRWYWESEVDAASVATAKRYFAEGKLQESQGAIGLDFSDDKLGFCMLLKTDGTGLYATKDVELARRKFEDFKIQKSIYVVDMRQALHFKQVFKTLEVLGFSQAKDCFHLQYNFVELPDGAMSSRKGNIVPLMSLVEKMRAHVKSAYLQRYANEWTSEEIESIADKVAQGAIKYGMLRQDTNKKIVFDMDEWLKLDGESGPFIQYSFARIKSLVKKLSGPNSLGAGVDGSLLTEKSEIQLMQHLMNFNVLVVLCAENYKPASMCTFLYEAAKKFNVFYHDCPIGTAATPALREARLSLARATGEVLEQGAALLGISMPDKM